MSDLFCCYKSSAPQGSVSELGFITEQAVYIGRAIVECKGKSRIIFLPKKLCKILTRFCKEQKITRGVVFCTGSVKLLDRCNIWRDMKNLCKYAGVEESKVFPHNLWHLFARTYYSIEKDLSQLAELLGHSNITTTRIYTMGTGKKHLQQLERMFIILKKIMNT